MSAIVVQPHNRYICNYTYIHMYICMQNHNGIVIMTREDFFQKTYTSHFIVRFACEGELETEKDCNILTSQPLQTSPCVVLVLLSCSTRGLGAQPLWDMFSFQHLLTNFSGPQLTDFLSSPSYIIVQSPTQSLKWHV